MSVQTQGFAARYIGNSIATASPARLIVMLYGRLVLDLSRAEAALAEGQRDAASEQLMHAQDIVVALLSSLRPELWDGGPGLESLYVFLHARLILANTTGDAEIVSSCRSLVEPLRDAWQEALLQDPAVAL